MFHLISRRFAGKAKSKGCCMMMGCIRSGLWLASFALALLLAHESGVPMYKTTALHLSLFFTIK